MYSFKRIKKNIYLPKGTMKATFSKGLEGVIVDETKISNVEGKIGRLTYRGYPIEDLVKKYFSEVAWLVLFGKFPDKNEKNKLEEFLSVHSNLSRQELNILRSISKNTHPMLVLQSMVPILDLKPKIELEVPLNSEDSMAGLIINSKIPNIIAAFYRIQNNREVLETNPKFSFHENFLYLISGNEPGQEEIQVMDMAQILQLEHGFNASTFSGRVTASTLAPIQSVISAAIGTLYGKLHGGADEAALNMAMSINSPDKAEEFVKNALINKQKIMGMGHREYKTIDPRAKILKPIAEKLCVGSPFESLFMTLKKVESAFRSEMSKNNKDIWANVDFYKGAVYYALGIPSHYFTSIFAMTRSFGYLAHFLESRKDNRLIRPKALYTGKLLV